MVLDTLASLQFNFDQTWYSMKPYMYITELMPLEIDGDMISAVVYDLIFLEFDITGCKDKVMVFHRV